MAKQTKKRTVSSLKGTEASQYEHSESIDDSLLPEASELERLKGLDPNIMEWVKERTAKEQDTRLAFNTRKLVLFSRAQKLGFAYDITSLAFGFIVIMGGMLFSAYLIHSGNDIQGTIFAGGTLILAATAFIRVRKRDNKNKE